MSHWWFAGHAGTGGVPYVGDRAQRRAAGYFFFGL
jgi:hypothetical protein